MKKETRAMSEDKNKVLEERIGIMGGTFNPIHIGHLFIAETAQTQLDLHKVLFVPNGMPPHKEHADIVDANHRLLMTGIAINHHEKFFLSDIEINRKGFSYTVNTMKELLQIHGENTRFYFIIGTDAFMEMETWKNYKDLFALMTIVVTTRLGYRVEDVQDKIKQYTEKFGATIIEASIPILEISSEDIRKRIKEGKTIKYLVPDEVEKYIRKQQLYTNGDC